MVQTSNFAKSGNDPLAIAISVSTPHWYMGRIFPQLYPPIDLLNDYKNGLISQEVYTHRYNLEVLAKLDPYDVIDMIEDDAILICWEGSGEFCHRRLVAKWLEDALEISVPEVCGGRRKTRLPPKREIHFGQTTLSIH
jgi:hypothetical protein